MSRDHVERLALRVTREILDLEEEMVSLEPPETPDPPAQLDHLDHQAWEGTLLLRWLEVLMRRLEVLRWV